MGSNIEPWEAALIKAMRAAGQLNRDQIIAYFSRPGRTVNTLRISDVDQGKIHPDIPTADPLQVAAYLETFDRPHEARQRFFDENPMHGANLRSRFTIRAGTVEVLDIGETDRVECKESLNFANRADYARVMVSFANAHGGFLIFGVRDADKVITGITKGRLDGYDPAKLNQHLSEHFTPTPIWEKAEFDIAGKTIGLIYTRPAMHRPIICTRDEGTVLREADIYYRYPGETKRIKYAELVGILAQRSKQTEQLWKDILGNVERVGVENVAILNTASGEVRGSAGRFLIDKELVPKLKFITEGSFSETMGDPTLKLIGTLEPINVTVAGAGPVVIKKTHLRDADLLDAFLCQTTAETPRIYVCHLAHTSAVWLPVFYFIRLAGMTEADACALIDAENSKKSSHVTRLKARITGHTRPAGAPSRLTAGPVRAKLLSRDMEMPTDDDGRSELLKAIRTLLPGEIDIDYIFPILCNVNAAAKNRRIEEAVRYAAAHLDVVLHLQVLNGTREEAKAP